MVLKSGNRESNIECLRIVCMLLIVLCHLRTHGIWSDNTLTINRVIADLFTFGGGLGVNCFVLISGWFLCKSKFSVKSLLKLLLQTAFYSYVIAFAFLVVEGEQNNVSLSQILLPTIFGEYWFVSAYVGMFLMSPVLRVLIRGISQKQFNMILAIGFIVFSVIPTFSSSNFVVTGFVWFCYLWLISAYLRAYRESRLSKLGCGAFAACFAVVEISILLLDGFGQALDSNQLIAHSTYLKSLYSIPILIMSIALFNIFTRIDLGSNAVINRCASGVFAVYLVHDNPLVRDWLWQSVFESGLFGLPAAGFVVGSFLMAICILLSIAFLDLLRQILLEKPLFRLLSRKFENVFERVDKSFNLVDG